MSEKEIRTQTFPNWQTIKQSNKKQTAADGGEGDKEDQLIQTFPTWQTINQLNKKQTAPDVREGDKDPDIPQLANYQSVE